MTWYSLPRETRKAQAGQALARLNTEESVLSKLASTRLQGSPQIAVSQMGTKRSGVTCNIHEKPDQEGMAI